MGDNQIPIIIKLLELWPSWNRAVFRQVAGSDPAGELIPVRFESNTAHNLRNRLSAVLLYPFLPFYHLISTQLTEMPDIKIFQPT